MIKPSFRAIGIGILASVFVVLEQGMIEGQEPDPLRTRLTLPELPTELTEALVLVFPGVTLASPAALGADQGVAYIGAGYQERTRYGTQDDGAVFLGFGFGDARKYFGVELCLTSFSTLRSGFFDRSGLAAQVHRFLGENTAIAAGVENFVLTRSDEYESDSSRSIYGVITHILQRTPDPTEPFGLVVATVGIGDGRFRSEDDILDGRSTLGVFGGLSFQVVRAVAVIADWTGQDLALGASIAPFSRIPFVITPAVMDLTGSAGDGARFVITLGAGYRLTGSGGVIQF